MILTDFQKELVGDILAGRIIDMDSFITSRIETKLSINVSGTHFVTDDYQICPNEKVYVVQDEHAALVDLREFVVLWKLLEMSNLIYSLSVTRRAHYPLWRKNGGPFHIALHMIYQFMLKEMIPFPQLNDFAKNGFRTGEEIEEKAVAKDRRLTRTVAYLSLLISTALAIGNFWSNTTERTVTIKNLGAFADTTKVLVLPQEKVPDKTDSMTVNPPRKIP